MAVSKWMVIAIVLAAIGGPWLHEISHLVFGKLGGGSPYISKWGFAKLYPREIDYRKPDRMSNRMVRMTGGFVVIFPILMVVTWDILWWSENLALFPLIILFFLASFISWLDLLALYEPERWKRFTRGEPIKRDDR